MKNLNLVMLLSYKITYLFSPTSSYYYYRTQILHKNKL